MTLELWMADAVHMTTVGDDIVVLDLKHDAYAGIVGGGAWMAPQPDGSVTVSDETAALDLQTLGLITVSPLRHARRMAAPARRALEPAARVGRLETLGAAAGLARRTLGFGRRALIELVAEAERPARSRRLDEREPGAALATWRAALPFVPGEGECLQRAFLLHRHLAGHGIRADWVFGVRTWPFSAHCWIQVDDMVIGDTVERVGVYTPILTV